MYEKNINDYGKKRTLSVVSLLDTNHIRQKIFFISLQNSKKDI